MIHAVICVIWIKRVGVMKMFMWMLHEILWYKVVGESSSKKMFI
jgi:hypothetical protein